MMMWLIGRSRSDCSVMTKKGIALLEVMLSILILSVGLVAVYRPFLSALSTLQKLNDRIEASGMLSQKMWEVISTVRSAKSLDWKTQREELIGKNKTFEYSVQKELLTSDELLYRLVFHISWMSGRSRQAVMREILLSL